MSRSRDENGSARVVTIVRERDGTTGNSYLRIPFGSAAWIVGFGSSEFLLVLGAALYGPLVWAAARVPECRRELGVSSENIPGCGRYPRRSTVPSHGMHSYGGMMVAG